MSTTKTTTPRVVYVAGPLGSGEAMGPNVTRAIEAGARVLELGGAPVVPHLFYFLDRLHPQPYESWMRVDLAILARCDVVWRLPGRSPGADREVEHARELGLPVVHGRDELAAWLGGAR